MKLSNKALILFIFIGFALMFYLLNTNTNIAIDDYSYKFIWSFENVKNRVQNLADVISSMKVHYFRTNGRLLVNGLAQLFLINDDKSLFNILNTSVLLLVMILVYKLAGKQLKAIKVKDVLFFVLAFWFLIPGPNHSLLWLTGSINYLWAMALVLIFLIVYKKFLTFSDNVSIYLYPLLFLLGFAAGFTHEVISVGVSGALFFIHLKNIRKIKPALIWLISGFFLGTLILIIAPGNFIRLEGNAEHTPGILANLIHRAAIFFMPQNLIAFLLLIGSMILLKFKNPQCLKQFFIEQKLFLLSIFFSLLFIIMAGAYQPRVFFGIAVFSILLLYVLFNKFTINISVKYVNGVLFFFLFIMLLEWSTVYKELKYNYSNFKQSEVIWKQDIDEEVFPGVTKKRNRFVSFGLGKLDKIFWSNIVMASYYGHTSMIFLPGDLYNSLKNEKIEELENIKLRINSKGISNNLFFDKITGYYILPIKDILMGDSGSLIFRTLKGLRPDAITLKEKIFYNLLGKERENINSEKGKYFKIEINKRKYILFQKPKLIKTDNLSQIEIFPSNKSKSIILKIR